MKTMKSMMTYLGDKIWLVVALIAFVGVVSNVWPFDMLEVWFNGVLLGLSLYIYSLKTRIGQSK